MIIRDTALLIVVEDRKHSSSVVEAYNSFTLRRGEFGGDMTQVSDSKYLQVKTWFGETCVADSLTQFISKPK